MTFPGPRIPYMSLFGPRRGLTRWWPTIDSPRQPGHVRVGLRVELSHGHSLRLAAPRRPAPHSATERTVYSAYSKQWPSGLPARARCSLLSSVPFSVRNEKWLVARQPRHVTPRHATLRHNKPVPANNNRNLHTQGSDEFPSSL